MYTEIANNDYYELGIVGDLVCLQFKPAFDQVLGEDRGKGTLGVFGGIDLRSDSCSTMAAYSVYLPGKYRTGDTDTTAYDPDNPQKYAEQLHGALQEYIASKQPFQKNDHYWTFTFSCGELHGFLTHWDNDAMDATRLALNIAFKTKEECERCIEETKEFWRSR